MRRDQWQSYLGLPRRLALTQDMGLLLNAGGKARDPLDHNGPIAQPTGTPGPILNRIPDTAEVELTPPGVEGIIHEDFVEEFTELC